MYTKADIEKLAEDFVYCRKVLTALGDANRQHLILEMMKMENCSGARVGDITERTHLSRPCGIPPSPDFEGCGNFEGEERGNEKLLLF